MRFSTILLGAPAVIVAAVVAVANRQTVRFSLDPFAHAVPAFAFDSPLFVLLFAALGLGAVLGAGAALLSRGGGSPKPEAKAGAESGAPLLPGRGAGTKPPQT